MGSHNPFGFLKHKLWPKEGRESNWQFDSRPLKVKITPIFLGASGMPHTIRKLLMSATTLL